MKNKGDYRHRLFLGASALILIVGAGLGIATIYTPGATYSLPPKPVLAF